jgi:hypothetical protein
MSSSNLGPSAFDITKTAEQMRDMRLTLTVPKAGSSEAAKANAGTPAPPEGRVWVAPDIGSWVRFRR